MKNIILAAQKIKSLLKNTINNQKGVVLPLILMALGGLSLLGAAAISVSSGEMNIAHNDRNYKTAFNLAEAGINDAADGIGGNRDLLPRPLGAITTASYSFSVGGTAFSNTGRYNVIVSIPVVTTVTADIALNASTVVVQSLTGLNVGSTIIVGNTTSHYMTTIGSINTSTNTLTLADSQGRPYAFKETFSASNTWVALNLLRITSTGQAGTGLSGTGASPNTIAGWRNVGTINTTPNPTLTTPAGAIRSTVKLQGDYTLQEIAVFNSFDAQVNNTGNTFKGPILVTNSLIVKPYTQGSYTGPIFNATNPTNAGAIVFKDSGGTTITNTSILPKIINVPGASGKVNLDTILANAASNAACYQQACTNASGTQQIYYLNGYQVDVKPYKPTLPPSTGFPMTIDEESITLSGGNIVFSFTVDTTFTTGSNDDVNINVGSSTTPSSSDNQTPTLINVSQATDPVDGIGISGQNISFANNTTYYAGTVVTVSFPAGDIGYLRIWDNNNNNGISGANKGWSNGVWVTALGNVESQAKQGDVNWLADAGAGTHADPAPATGTGHNHSTILTTEPTTYYRGTYATSDTASSSTTTWTNSGEGALLFGGRNKNSTAWVVGDVARYYTTYYIHTNASGSCNDHDIKIVSYTKVTYLGTSTKCTDTDRKKLFLYETIWNHTATNTIDSGIQTDDTDTKLGYIPHKGYFKWVRDTDSAENKLFKGVEVLMGDKEFASVFNHSTDSRFTSAVINANISKIRMIGWANPPLKFNSTTNRMDVYPVEFASSPVWSVPVNASGATSWDWPDMIGTRSQFASTSAKNGFDFSNFSTVMNSINTTTGYIEAYQTSPGTYKLPDMSTINSKTSTTNNTGTGTINLYSAGSNPATTWPGTWSANGTKAMPGNPILDSSGLQTTVITATISGPSFTTFEIKRGAANLFFDAANGIPFNINELKIETKGAGASITMGSSTNPATVFANEIKLESENCGGTINFDFTGKMVAKEVEFENNVQYNIDTTLGGGASCLSPQTASFIYLRKNSWKEIRD